ncbi:MAG: hypothetical protein ABR969_10925 [Sedimentisphaerales bacterium]|jgi:hypothetical protein
MRWIMKIGRLIGRNVFTSIWLLVIILDFLGVLLGCGYEVSYHWQGYGFYFLYYISKYISWPSEIPFFTSFFVTSDGFSRIKPPWFAIISLMITLAIYIAIDYLLRKLLWNKKQVPEKNIV